MTRPGEPPEVTQAAEAEADALWAALEKDMPDSIDLKLVKPHVVEALRLAFSRGTLLVMQRGMETLKEISDKEKARRPVN
jgi:hypothetical protein